MTDTEATDGVKRALEAVEEVREDLEAIRESDLPFAKDAADILEDADQLQRELEEGRR